MDGLKCLERSPACVGAVELRTPLSGTGVPYPRCDAHWSARLDRHQEDQERDANARRVDWFDAGEVYDDGE
jgi:hypothetical protein